MSFLPEWAPTLHPLIIHFPIALLFAAALLDGLGLIFRKQTAWRFAAIGLYVLGAVGALASFFTGRQAAEALMLPAEANTSLTEHADLALWTVWFFGIYALVRLVALRLNKQARPIIWGPLMLVGVGGLFLLYETAEHGAQMVYQHGVGVAAVQAAEVAPPTVITREGDDEAGPMAGENGAWTWKPVRAAAWKPHFAWLDGTPEALQTALVERDERGEVLALEAQGTPTMFVLDQPLGSIQTDLVLNTDGFTGTVMVIHHAKDAQNYLFTALADGQMRQGRVRGGTVEMMDEKAFAPEGWQHLRVVADKTHFRAYAEGRMITHGHGDAPDPGSVGLRLDGSGTVLLDFIDVQSLR